MSPGVFALSGGRPGNLPELSRTLQNHGEDLRCSWDSGIHICFPKNPHPTGQTAADPKSAGEGKECEPNTRGAPGGLPRGRLWPTRRTWGPQRGPPKRCPSLKFKCARGAASACEHADPGTDVGRAVGRSPHLGGDAERGLCLGRMALGGEPGAGLSLSSPGKSRSSTGDLRVEE